MEESEKNSKLKIKEEDRPVKERIRTLPLTVQPLALEALEAFEENDYEKTVSLCQKALDTEPFASLSVVRLIMGLAYMCNNEMNAAKNVFLDLVQDDPDDPEARRYLGYAHHGLMEFRDAVRELKRLYPESITEPHFLSVYGDSLQYTGHQKEAREIFRQDVEQFYMNPENYDPGTISGTFQSLLTLDVRLANGKYPEDLQSYYDFLDGSEMTDEMQSYLSGTIASLSTLMEYKWYQPLFRQLVDHIEQKQYIRKPEYASVVESARISLESYDYHEDPQVNMLVEEFLNSYYSYTYAKNDHELNKQEDILSEKQKENEENVLRSMEIKARTFEWNMAGYYPEHREELEYVKKQYPHIYALVEPFLEQLKEDPEKVQEELLQELYQFNRGGYSKETFQNALESAFQKLVNETENERNKVVHGGYTPYKRGHAKIGRNDPCPCGSGKKYKNCCGRNA